MAEIRRERIEQAESNYLMQFRAFTEYHFDEIKDTPRGFLVVAIDKTTDEGFVSSGGTFNDVTIMVEELLTDPKMKEHAILAIQSYLKKME